MFLENELLDVPSCQQAGAIFYMRSRLSILPFSIIITGSENSRDAKPKN
ncbi:MAG: hypothetical protein ACRCUY_13375 [Thermoguttaceae bacterium]